MNINLLYFIRLLFKHIILLILLPIGMAALVYFLTQNQPQEYIAKTRLYTGITTGSSIVSLESAKVDLFGTRTAFDNLINVINARSTLDEVSIRLLATHLLMDGPAPEIISEKSYEELKKIIPKEIKKLVVKGDIEATVDNLRDYKDKNFNNFIYRLINKNNHPHYSSEEIETRIKIRRVQSSDMVDIIFTSNDPGICKSTLDILTTVFIKESTNIKANQSDAVVKYFERQLALAHKKLEDAENELLQFNRDNAIINYYEQTRHISAEKKDFDLKHLDIKLENAGAKSAITDLERRMTARQRQRITNQKINDIRKELSKVNYKIAMATFEAKEDKLNASLFAKLEELQLQAKGLEIELKEKVQDQYSIDNSKEGVGSKVLMDEWIEKIIEFEATQAQLNVAEIEKKQFKKIFISYAPLGATMKRLERKINVAEQEYLSILHNLGVAQLKQQNIELGSNIKIISKPLLPIVPQPSKRKFLILIAMFLGFLIPASIIILLEFVDQNLRTATRATEIIGLPVAAIFPKLLKPNKKLDVDFIKNRGLSVIARRLILNTEKTKDKQKPDTNLLFSSLDAEGKTKLASLLLERLAWTGYKILFLTYEQTGTIEGVQTLIYKIDNSFHRIEKVEDLDADFNGITLNNFDYIFIEIPGILHHSYPINLFKNTEHSFLVARANRAWTKSDSYALKDIVDFVKDKKPQILLNGVEMAEMETVIGDLPKKRSRFRQFLKNMFRLRFFTKKELKP